MVCFIEDVTEIIRVKPDVLEGDGLRGCLQMETTPTALWPRSGARAGTEWPQPRCGWGALADGTSGEFTVNLPPTCRTATIFACPRQPKSICHSPIPCSAG